MIFPNSSSCGVCLKLYLHGAGRARGTSLELLLSTPECYKEFTLFYPGKRAKSGCPVNLWANPSIDFSLSMLGLMPTCVHTLETPACSEWCCESVCVCYYTAWKPLNSHSTWGMGKVTGSGGEQMEDAVLSLQRHEVPQILTPALLLRISLYS